ncbi:MAG: peptidylprolyl isomerase [Gemmatimonadales bacterium]
MQKFPWFVGLVATVGCGALSDAFTAHPDVVVRVDDQELSVGRFAELLVLGQSLPLTQAIADELARHWVDVTALAARSASGDSLMDTTTVLASMWLEQRQSLMTVFHSEVFADREGVTPEAVDSAYRVGDMLMLAHILRRVTPETTAEEKGQQLALALRLHDGLVSSLSWEEANKENEDEIAQANNGSLGIVTRGQTVPRFENAAYALAPGELSGVVETQFGYHIIYRPRLDEGREAFTAYVQEAVSAQLDSVYGERLLEAKAVEVRPDAPATVREIAGTPIRALESSRVLASYSGGRFTTGQFARWLLYIPGTTYEQLLVAPDDQITNFTRRLVLQELLWEQADSAGVEMTDSLYAVIEDKYRYGLQGVWDVVGIWPDSLAILGATPTDREAIARNRVDGYFESVAARRVPLRPIPPFLAERLRRDVKWEIFPAGIDAALELAARLRAVTARSQQPPAGQNQP